MTDKHPHDELLDRRNVLAVFDDADGKRVAIVSQKLPEDELDPDDLVATAEPARTTDVIDAGMGEDKDALDPMILPDEFITAESDRHTQHRPIPGGVSEAHHESTAATAGPWVAEVTDPTKGVWGDAVQAGDLVRLSNCHVYAKSGQASIGDEILQPSPRDGGGIDSDVSGALAGYLPLEDGVVADVAARSSKQSIDEALHGHNLDEGWPTGVIRGDYSELVGETVTKTGRTTGVKEGTLRGAGASINVSYPHGTVRLREQLITEHISQGGDSGSPVFTMDGEILGLVFAGSPKISAISAVGLIESAFGVRIHTSVPEDDEGNERGSGRGGTDSDDGSDGSSGGKGGSDSPDPCFLDHVEELLVLKFGEQNVERGIHLDTVDHTIDFFVRTDVGTLWAVEVENERDMIPLAMGQSQIAAAAALDEYGAATTPMVVVPETILDARMQTLLARQGVPALPVTIPADISISGV